MISNATHIIQKEQIINICIRALKFYAPATIQHGERVAQIAYYIWHFLSPEMQKSICLKDLMILCIFHDIGAYNVSDLEKLIAHQHEDVQNHASNGYLFFKYFSPLPHLSQAIFYHHISNDCYTYEDCSCKDYANLIHLADFIDAALVNGVTLKSLFTQVSCNQFDAVQVTAFKKAFTQNSISQIWKKDETTFELLRHFLPESMSKRETFEYLKMVIYILDFKSSSTMFHSYTTAQTAAFLAKKCNLDIKEIEKIYLAALLHDIGKIAVPYEILEGKGKLSFAQRAVMESHVLYTKEITQGILSSEIIHMATAHHEKLNGTGYPLGLWANQLTLAQRIIAVADIFSALQQKRSYKESFSKQEILEILHKMVIKNEIDLQLVTFIKLYYEELKNLLEKREMVHQRRYQKAKQEYFNLTTMALL